MNNNQKKGIRICALSFPLTYVIALLLNWITILIDRLIPGVIILATPQITIIPLMIMFNVIALIVGLGKRE